MPSSGTGMALLRFHSRLPAEKVSCQGEMSGWRVFSEAQTRKDQKGHGGPRGGAARDAAQGGTGGKLRECCLVDGFYVSDFMFVFGLIQVGPNRYIYIL